MSYSINLNDVHNYKCYFEFDGKVINCEGINPIQFTNGFWISGEQISQKRAGKVYWINPAKIEYIVADTDEAVPLKTTKEVQAND